MAYLRYVGPSKYGVSVALADLRTKVTIVPDKPYKLKEKLNDDSRRYYSSLISCDLEFVVETTDVSEEVNTNVESENISENNHKTETTEETIEVTPEVTKESLFESLKASANEDLINELSEKLGVKSRKKTVESKLWDILDKTELTHVLEVLAK